MFSLPAVLLSALPLISSVLAQNTSLIYHPIYNTSTIEIQLSPGVLSLTNTTTNFTLPPVTQRLSYFVVDGAAIIDGDIAFGTEAELLAYATGNNAKRGLDKRSLSLFPNSVNKWPGGVISYKWDSQASKDARLADWTEAVKRWTDRLPFLSFVEVSPFSATLQTDVVTLVSSHVGGGCFSPVGRDSPYWIKLDDCGGAGTFTHELGHLLGLWHEQQRPDRASYMQVNCENVADDSNGVKAVCTNPCQGLGCNFRLHDSLESDWSGAYDVLSLMHYSEYEFSGNGLPTLTPLPGIPHPLSHNLPTLSDARRVCDLYWEDCRGVCGDGIFSPNNEEECDDGNNIDGDGCSANCKIETPKCALQTCDPTVGLNGCDISTSCISLDGATQTGVGEHMCACRHGFRADGTDPKDTSVQIRLPWASQEGRVFVKPGVACNQLCDSWMLGKDGCKEVLEEPVCY